MTQQVELEPATRPWVEQRVSSGILDVRSSVSSLLEAHGVVQEKRMASMEQRIDSCLKRQADTVARRLQESEQKIADAVGEMSRLVGELISKYETGRQK
jgi:ElaB/YqjD/DUF883 family membrane-anchored ribosome-binding protein